MYRLLIEATEGDRFIHALRLGWLMILYRDDALEVHSNDEGEWSLIYRAETPVRWRLFTDDGTELQEGRWYPFSHRGSEVEGGQG